MDGRKLAAENPEFSMFLAEFSTDMCANMLTQYLIPKAVMCENKEDIIKLLEDFAESTRNESTKLKERLSRVNRTMVKEALNLCATPEQKQKLAKFGEILRRYR